MLDIMEFNLEHYITPLLPPPLTTIRGVPSRITLASQHSKAIYHSTTVKYKRNIDLHSYKNGRYAVTTWATELFIIKLFTAPSKSVLVVRAAQSLTSELSAPWRVHQPSNCNTTEVVASRKHNGTLTVK